MPILYVHGVNVRSRQGFRIFEPFARRYLAPEISGDPSGVTIQEVYWGELAFKPAFGGASRPRSRLLGMGADGDQAMLGKTAALGLDPERLDEALGNYLPEDSSASGSSAESNLAGGGLGDTGTGELGIDWNDGIQWLHGLSDEDLADVLSILVRAPTVTETAGAAEGSTEEDRVQEAWLAAAAGALVEEGEARAILSSPGESEDILTRLLTAVGQRADADNSLAGMGFGDWLARSRDRLGEVSTRAGNLKGYLVSVVLAEARAPLHAMASRFLGDVFVYLKQRGDANAPGPIQSALLDELVELSSVKKERGGEPLVVVSHSMGGQLMYDALTHYLPGASEFSDIKVDFWCASASQVGFFEEAKLFHASRSEYKNGNPVPFPDRHLGYWWNVWDHNDVLSFTAKDIVIGVNDSSYSSGTTLLEAHGAYLSTPSFYRRMAEQIRDANLGAE